jgi:hypothetical protein
MIKSILLFFRKSFTTNFKLKLEVIFLTKQLEIYQRTDPKLKIKKNRPDVFHSYHGFAFKLERKTVHCETRDSH